MDRVGSMSDEEAGVVFQDSAGAEAFAAEAPEAEGGKPGELEPYSRWIWGSQLSGKGLQQFSGGCRRCGLRRSSSSALFVGVPSRERSRLLAFPPARVLGSGLVRVAGTSLAKGLKITG